MLSALDTTGLRVEADIIYLAALAGIPLPVAEGMELWEIAAARGMHYTETLQDHNVRTIDVEQAAVWEETQVKRQELLARQAERRRERKRRR